MGINYFCYFSFIRSNKFANINTFKQNMVQIWYFSRKFYFSNCYGYSFFLVVTPIGIIMRLMGKNLLGLKKDNNKKSYWMKKDNYKTSMKKQF